MYVILKQNELASVPTEATFGDTGWVEIGKQAASNREGAIRAFMNEGENGDMFGEGSYRAVSETSWGEPVPIAKKISFG
jgi:hypothetical protein